MTELNSRENIWVQGILRPELTEVIMNCDYERFRSDLERMDHLIECSYLDAMAVDFALENLGTQASERERHNRREGMTQRHR